MTLHLSPYRDDSEKKEYREFVAAHHYSRKCPGARFAYGLHETENGGLCDLKTLVGCVIFSIPASYTLCRGVCGIEFSKNVIELSRLVITTSTKNAASFCIGRALRLLPDSVVVSYADCNSHIGHVGYVYQATNWLYTGQGSAEPIWETKDGTVVSYTRRHIDTKAAKLGLKVSDLVKRKQVGKHRYVCFAGARKFRIAAKKAMRYEVKKYPKGSTTRHTESALKLG